MRARDEEQGEVLLHTHTRLCRQHISGVSGVVGTKTCLGLAAGSLSGLATTSDKVSTHSA
jgi:hypothetical protein